MLGYVHVCWSGHVHVCWGMYMCVGAVMYMCVGICTCVLGYVHVCWGIHFTFVSTIFRLNFVIVPTTVFYYWHGSCSKVDNYPKLI